MNALQRTAVLFITLLSLSQARALVLPSGLALDPDPSLDITYQVVPEYDPIEKIIAVWGGDRLQYFVTVVRLPAQWLDAEKYFQAFLRDLRAAGRPVEAARSARYRVGSSIAGQYLELRSTPSPQATPTTQAVHFISDGKLAFVGIATLVARGGEDRMLQETTLLFQSASFSSGAAPQTSSAKAESLYAGTWKWDGQTPNGDSASSTVTLKDDLSFLSDVTIGTRLVFRAVGVWSVSGQHLFWTFMRSEPPLPADKREDEDEIVSFDRERLVLRSKLTGKERIFVKQ
jgi:hypothetical protein